MSAPIRIAVLVPLVAAPLAFGAPSQSDLPCASLPKNEQKRYLRLRERITDRVSIVRRYVAREAGDVFGGVSIEDDCARGPYVLVRFTRELERHEAALKRLFPYPRNLRTAQVARTLGELRALRERISADVKALDAEGFHVSGFGPRLDENVVGVEVITRREDAQAFFAARYGDAVRVDVIARERYKLVSTKAGSYSVSRSGRTLRLRWTTNSVYDLVRVEVRETRRRVSVRIVERAPNGPVTLMASLKDKLLRLQRPLGRREVFDAAARKPLRRLKRSAPAFPGG